MKWTCSDGNEDVEIEAETAKEAAELYAEEGDWPDGHTFWVNVYVQPSTGDEEADFDQRQFFKIPVHPEEPECSEDDHDWQSPYSLLGGLESNPGVWGHGGGVKYTEVCMNCGCGRHVDTWAQDPQDGQQGLYSIEYVPREFEDEIERMKEEEEE